MLNQSDVSAQSVLRIHQHLLAVTEKAAGAVVPAMRGDPWCAVVPGSDLVPVGVQPRQRDQLELPGEYGSPLQLGSRPWELGPGCAGGSA